MKRRHKKPFTAGVVVCALIWMMVVVPLSAISAPYAEMVMDARNGKVLVAENADTRLHPASLTKMMTLYIAFEAIENGEISADKKIRISKKAALEPPSKLGLRHGQRIKLRYLIRAAAVRSANDAATAIGEAIEGSEAAFARRMTRTAKALGMTRTTFKNAHGLTEKGHLSTARDMTILGRHLFYDYPDYYHLFSRITVDAGTKNVPNTNRRFLRDFKGADGIKTGYTRAAGFNLVASAERRGERIIATVFGGRSTKTRNAQVAKLLNHGFKKAPSSVTFIAPRKPNYSLPNGAFDRRLRTHTAVKTSLRPKARPEKRSEPELLPEPILALTDTTSPLKDGVKTALIEATATGSQLPIVTTDAVKVALEPPSITPSSEPKIVSRLSNAEENSWGINVGRYPSRYAAEKMLLKTALAEMSTLNGSNRKVIVGKLGFDANFTGLSEASAERACLRLRARNVECSTVGPS